MEELNKEIGEMICDVCEGTGNSGRTRFAYFNSSGRTKRAPVSVPCKKCRGTGKVDWVENVIGEMKGAWIKPEVHIKEVDLSYIVDPDIITDGKLPFGIEIGDMEQNKK